MAELERRTLQAAGLELRQTEADKPPRIVGHAAVFNDVVDLGFFKERFLPGAFKQTLDGDVRALINHDPQYVLGRTTAGTLRLSEDDKGLVAEIDPPNTQAAKDLMESIRRGDVTGMSIGFVATDEEWEPVEGGQLRTVRAAQLSDVSVVTFPAYEQTDVSIRAKELGRGINMSEKTATVETQTENRAVEDRAVMAEVAATTVTSAVDEQRAAFVRYLRTGETRALRESTDTTGGVLAPTGFIAEVIRKREEQSVMRRLARPIGPITQAKVSIPRLLTGLTADWLDEGAALTPKDTTFDQLTLTPHKMGVLTQVSNELLADGGVDIETFLATLFGEALGRHEDQAFFNGTGVGQPKGILTDADVPSVNAAAAAAISLDDILALYDALPPQYRGTAAWIMSPAAMTLIRKLKDSTGRLLLTSDLSGAAPVTILGRPVYLTSNVPAPAANAKSVLFGDFSAGYVICDRVGLDVQRSSDRYFEQDLTAFRALARVDGQVAVADAVRVLKHPAA